MGCAGPYINSGTHTHTHGAIAHRHREEERVLTITEVANGQPLKVTDARGTAKTRHMDRYRQREQSTHRTQADAETGGATAQFMGSDQ